MTCILNYCLNFELFIIHRRKQQIIKKATELAFTQKLFFFSSFLFCVSSETKKGGKDKIRRSKKFTETFLNFFLSLSNSFCLFLYNWLTFLSDFLSFFEFLFSFNLLSLFNYFLSVYLIWLSLCVSFYLHTIFSLFYSAKGLYGV